MRFFHISDLHFGKQLYGYDLTEEHRNFIRQLGKYCEEYSPDAVLIAGDIYDRAVPSAGAVTLMDELLTTLSSLGRFKSDLQKKANDIMINPMEYISKSIISYKNPARPTADTYTTSIYSGMIYNGYC